MASAVSFPDASFVSKKKESTMSNVVKTDGADPNNAINPNTFGRSVESQAQIRDAAAMASPVVDSNETLNIYRLEPIAAAGDPRWGNAPSHGAVVVAARTSGDARIVAAACELDFMEVDAAPAEDVTTMNASAFRDDKLYTVIEIEHGRSDLKRGLIEGNISVDTIRPTQE
jgi:hypothetical protein